MRRICQASLLAAILLASCSDRSPTTGPTTDAGGGADPRQVAEPRLVRTDAPAGTASGPAAVGDEITASLPGLTKDDRFDAVLHEAIDLLADRKYKEALAALQKAQKISDTGAVQREIDKVQAILDQQAAAEKAVGDVKTVLDQGNPNEAARLAGQALAQYGGGDAADKLGKLKREADAVVTASGEDAVTRRVRLETEARTAMKEQNLRAAAIAFEGALALGDNPVLRKDYEGIQQRLARYDEAREKAHSCRKDPAQLDQAVTCLRQAAEAWDTLQVRQEIDEYTLLLSRRKDRLSVADFEVRGEPGVPGAGRLVAEELLPTFKPRFEPVERAQLGKVIGELKLEASDLAEDTASRQELGRLAKIRYLVVGSLTPLGGGVRVSARLIEVSTGLVVQTATLSAASVEDLLPRLKQLSALLQMTDEQKLAFEEKVQTVSTVVVQPIEVPAVVVIPPPPPPPPPPTVVLVQRPAVIITWTSRPPASGGLVIADFRALPPIVTEPPPPPAVEVVIQREDPRRKRLLALSLEMGDNLYRRGRAQEAQRHFQVALSLSGGHTDIQVRIDNCRRYAPPPPPPTTVVVITPPPPPRPRLVVFGFLVNCPPGVGAPAVGDWAADHFVSYFGNQYEVVDRGEVCWYMGRLGLTMRDVMVDPAARICLAQALNARYFVFGAIEHTASLNVSTHLIDAQSGARTATGTIHVQDHQELKLRSAELAKQMGAKPAEQAKLAASGAASEKALNEARKLMAAGNYAQAAVVARAGLQEKPDSVALQALAQEAEHKAQQKALEEQRQKEARAQADALAQARKRQEELAKQAAEARVRAEKEAKEKGDGLKRQQEAQRAKAAESLLAQARQQSARGDHAAALKTLQSAQALKPTDEGNRALASERAVLDQANRAKADAERKQREAEQQKQREAALARVAKEKADREKADAERRKAQEARDHAAHDALLKQANDFLARNQYPQALSTAQQAHRLQASDASAQVIHKAQEGIARAEAEKKGATARAEAERKLAEENKKRAAEKALAENKTPAVDPKLKQRQADYALAMSAGRSALKAHNYSGAVNAFNEALRLMPGDRDASAARAEAERGHQDELKQQEAKQKAQRDAQAAAEVERKRLADLKQKEELKRQEEAKHAAEVNRLTAAGQAAMAGRRFSEAAQAYGAALKLKPADAGLQKALRDAQAAADADRKRAEDEKRRLDEMKRQAEAKRQEEAKQAAEVNRLVAAGQAAMAGRRYADAVTAYGAAQKLRPADAGIQKALRDAQVAFENSKRPPVPPPPPPPPPVPPPAVEYNKQMQAAAAFEKQNRWTDAYNAYQAALKAVPGDARATAAQRNALFQAHLAAARAHHNAKRFADAVKSYEEALKVQPGNADATSGLQRARAGKP